ncbi:MAG: sulfatase-like hydrolase/transferase [Planctomycetota bacterium]|jgi:choline-sulfatase
MDKPHDIKRRDLLTSAAAGALGAMVAPNLAAAAADVGKKRRPPNILVIMSDEHNPNVLGCNGNEIVRTPNLDGLAERGVTFDAAYCNSPLCVPSRLSFTAGKYTSRVGAWSNSCWLPSADYPSIARAMNDAGYESFLGGKQHYDRFRRYGFTEIYPASTNGNLKNGKGGRRPPDMLTPKKEGYSARFDDFRTGTDNRVLKLDQQLTDHAIKFLNQRKPQDKPFFMFAGYLAPHFPITVPKEYWEPYKGKVPMPLIPPGHLESLPLNYKHLRVGFHMTNVPDHIVRKGRELYYGFTQWLDEKIGQVLKTLKDRGLAENTVVIYTTDHGENLGEHGLWWKNCMFDHAARVPLIVSWPERWKGGQRRTEACSLIDVVQTIAELGGAKMPDDCNGQSMCKWMDNPQTKWRDLALSEYYAHNIASGFVMIRQGNYKYVYHTPPDDQHPAQRELYDLKTDPGEFKNLAKDSDQQPRIKKMHAAMIAELGQNPDETELRCRADYAKGYDRPQLKRKAKRKKTKTKT